MVASERWKTGDRLDAQSGHPVHAGWQGRNRTGCLGACILSEVSKCAWRLHQGVVERGGLGQGRGTVRRGEEVTPRTVATKKINRPPLGETGCLFFVFFFW